MKYVHSVTSFQRLDTGSCCVGGCWNRLLLLHVFVNIILVIFGLFGKHVFQNIALLYRAVLIMLFFSFYPNMIRPLCWFSEFAAQESSIQGKSCIFLSHGTWDVLHWKLIFQLFHTAEVYYVPWPWHAAPDRTRVWNQNGDCVGAWQG